MAQALIVRWSALLLASGFQAAAAGTLPQQTTADFPPPLAQYPDSHLASLGEVLRHRIAAEPINLAVSLLFLAAILHTFFAGKFIRWADALEQRQPPEVRPSGDHSSDLVRLLHLLGEIEVVFVIWCVPLFLLLMARLGWDTAIHYFNDKVNYAEPLFVMVMMAISSTRPVLELAERCLGLVARLGGGSPAAWWFTILTVAPVLGSLITEPAAMTIAALLLAKRFYERKPSTRFAYASLGLLFVNISVGGVLTHFAAPPVVMVARAWNWTTPFMVSRFGWAAILGIVLGTSLYYLLFRKEFVQMSPAGNAPRPHEQQSPSAQPVPFWVASAHLLAMGWTVVNAHHPILVFGGFFLFIAFHSITHRYQAQLALRTPILVGLFLAGLVIHGGLQQWWIEPLLGRLNATPLLLSSIALTAFNDNAAITYLSTLVPSLNEGLKYAVVAGAVTGGGLTVIANAPNPAGQAILARFFCGGISPLRLLAGALPPTLILACCFLFFR